MATKKLILSSVSLPELELIGINTVLLDYRLAYFINKVAMLKLTRMDDLPVFNEKNKQLLNFPFFSYINTDYRLNYYLIANESTGIRMIDQFPQANYFLFVKGKSPSQTTKTLITSLRSISNVTMVFSVNPGNIKGLDGILQDLELHEVKLTPKPKHQPKLI